jgi:hypothetical protein
MIGENHSKTLFLKSPKHNERFYHSICIIVHSFCLFFQYYFRVQHSLQSKIFITYPFDLLLFSPIVSLHWEDFQQASQDIQETPDTRDLDVQQANTCIYEKANNCMHKSQVNDCTYTSACIKYTC